MRQLRELNPHVDLIPIAENLLEENAPPLVADVDLVVDAAPLSCRTVCDERRGVSPE